MKSAYGSPAVLFLLAVLITAPALADPDAATPYPTPIVNDNGTVTINNSTLPLVESRAIELNDSELAALDKPMSREEFMEANRQYIDFLAEQFGREQAEKMANAEYDRATSGSSLLSTPVNRTIIAEGTLAGTGEPQQAFPENDAVGYVPVEVIVIDPVIKAATPDYTFLVLENEGKATYLHDLKADFDLLYAADPKKDANYAALAAKLNAIWDKYPVVSETKPGSAGYPTYGGSEITLRFASSVTETKLAGDENAAIRESAAIMNEAYQKSHPTQPAPLPSILVIPALAAAGRFIFHRKAVKK